MSYLWHLRCYMFVLFFAWITYKTHGGKTVEKDLWMVGFPSCCLKLLEGNKIWIILKMWWFPHRTTPTGQTHRACWCENHLWWCPPKKSKQFYIKVRRWSFSSWNLSGSYTRMISDRRQSPQTWRFDTGAVVLSYIAHHTPRMRGMFPCNWFGSGLRANLGCCMSMCVASPTVCVDTIVGHNTYMCHPKSLYITWSTRFLDVSPVYMWLPGAGLSSAAQSTRTSWTSRRNCWCIWWTLGPGQICRPHIFIFIWGPCVKKKNGGHIYWLTFVDAHPRNMTIFDPSSKNQPFQQIGEVGGLEHDWIIFPYIGNNHPNWLSQSSYFSEG